MEVLAKRIGCTNLMPFGGMSGHVSELFCDAFRSLCDDLMAMFADADPTIDQRWDVFMSNSPAGSGYRNILHYSQLANLTDEQYNFQRYDHLEDGENQRRYGQPTPPPLDLSNIKFPVALMSGSEDLLADPTDVKFAIKELNHTLVFDKEYYLGHGSFAIAKNMSYFTVDAMTLINIRNGKSDMTCDSEFDSTNVQARHEYCAKPRAPVSEPVKLEFIQN